jgi:PLP dependent protein
MSTDRAAERLRDVVKVMGDAAVAAGRDRDDVALIAVSKTHDFDAIRPVLDAGQKIFGENRVQEAQGKWPAIRAEYPDTELHLIGPLQSNKVRDAVALFDWIHTIDREKIAGAIARERAAQDRDISCLVQVNTGMEPQKAGVDPDQAQALVDTCKSKYGLNIKGLMCIPPLDEEAALHFALLKKIAKECDLPVLSMGMSADFEKAIAFGATHVRVGTAIFGAR